ncbi:YeaC family protein [Microbulbifer sp. 2201CG32-9]|uniref:YeaC family protein n=1 Tax=Microbulbifer sp. 2201CG32-9 TaxID=3232309 RepID=UPI00345C01F7
MSFETLLNSLSPQVIGSLKRAIELGKWPDGRVLTDVQRRRCGEAVSAWEQRNLPPESRTGFVPPKESPCAPQPTDERKLTWV